jgi:hypothetical protein
MLDDPNVSHVIKEVGSFNAHIKNNLEDDNNNNPMISLIPSTTIGCLPCISSLLNLKPSGKPCSKPKIQLFKHEWVHKLQGNVKSSNHDLLQDRSKFPIVNL